MMATRRVTIVEVARKAGVSPTAVSFAFNKPHRLNGDTTERILQAARELGYAPNPHARALLSQRIGVIGVLVPQSLYAIYANPFFATFLQGIGSVCDDQDLALLTVSPLDGSLERAIASAPVDGFIIVGLNEHHHEVAPLHKRRVPFVIVDGDAETVPSVNIDDESGAYAAAAHLLANGHRNILILTFETPLEHLEDIFYGVGGRRVHGYQRAFADYGVPWRDDRLVPTLTSFEGGEQSFLNAWEAGTRPGAVLAVSDAMALGVVKAAAQLGLNIPRDLEVIGFDDVPLAALTNPALSTVHQPVYRKGEIAIELLVATLEANVEPKSVVLPTELILRATTR
ncbi:MAG: LacI family DNA-binding transcriptional regulator [Anaerolineae bacterium]|nr:LacI family DNA-binding transcriptional regulator [Anaerolineae bacterium]